MAIYKLDEVVYAVRGNSSFQKKDLNNEKLDDSFVALHYGKTYKVNVVDENFSYYASNIFYKDNQVINILDTVLVSTSETLEDLGHSYIYLRQDIGLLGGEQILLKANTNLILPEYLYYLTKQLKPQFRKYATGMKVYRFKIDDFKFITVDIPSLKEQQEIIDIIKPIEPLYLKYSTTVRIDNIEHCRTDVQHLIDIIKPIETCITNVQKQIFEIKKLLIYTYESNSCGRTEFSEVIELINNKYNKQLTYLATNAIGELSIDISKVQDVSENRPSRANLTPESNSIIFSKLDGENKVVFIDEKFNHVVSTGFFNIRTMYIDHVVGYILSQDFKKQKSLLATGTTMVGITNATLNKMMISKPTDESTNFVSSLSQLINLELQLKQELESCISLLVK